MGRSPDWMPDIMLRADSYEPNFYKKDCHKNSGSRYTAGGRYIIIHLFPNAHTAFHRHVLFDRLL